jgi:hypothetical protein
MNQPMNWSLEQVADIPRERSGKIRLCVSEIPPPESSFANSLLTPEQSRPVGWSEEQFHKPPECLTSGNKNQHCENTSRKSY